jgi:long-chain acyl-CoA synthetase
VIARGGPRPEPGTLTELFFNAAERFDKPDAFLVKIGGTYRPVSHRQVLERVRHAAGGLKLLGVRRGERVAILSETRFEWALADYVCLTAGCISVPVYPSIPADQVTYVLRNSGASAVFVSTRSQAKKLMPLRAALPEIRAVISFEPAGESSDMTLADLEADGRRAETPETVQRYRAEALAAKPDDLATIIYTSGTTGTPKGVMLSHDNLHSNVIAATRAVSLDGTDTSLAILPLSHVLARMADHFLMFATGTSIAFAESFESVATNIAEVRPTLVVAVPRLYEKIHARALENAVTAGGMKTRIFFWATAVGSRWADKRLAGRRPGPVLAAQYALARKLVFSKLQERTGGRLRCFVSGGAPLAPEINKFFYAAGLLILEGYGLTETSPLISVNTPADFPANFRIGTVGRPVAGVEVKIADDGEILTRGPHLMHGYYNDPDETRKVIDGEGWFHTGDIGVLEDGFLRITDRKKDIIVTAGGKNIAPQPVENRLKLNKFVGQAVMIGDKRKYPVMLIVPEFEQLEKWARSQGLAWNGHAELIRLPEVCAMMEREMQRTLTGLASFEMPKKLALLEEEFTIERGELTPSMKVKRRVIDESYKAIVDELYAGDSSRC